MSTYGNKNLTENRAPARDDAYTVMLSISLLAMIGACVILFYDLKRFPSPTPPAGYTKLPAVAPAAPPPGDEPGGAPPPAPAPEGNPPPAKQPELEQP